MKILVLTSSYPRFPGDGTAPFVDSISRGVAALGHEIHVLVPEHREWAWPATDGALHFHCYRYSPVRSWTPWGFSEALVGGSRIRKQLYPLAPLVFAAATWACRKLLADGSFDVLHAHWLVPNGPIGRAAAGPTPLVVSLHGSDVALAERSRMIRRIARRTLERANAVTAPSTDLLVRAKALGAREPLELVPYGADVATFHVSAGVAAAVRKRIGVDADDLLIVGVGRLVPVKGFDVLIDAFATASKRDERLRLILVGDGPERSRLARRVAALEISRTTTFVGAVSHDEIPAFLAAADVVAVPSVHRGGYVDGLPNVALEAMAAGRPLIATRVGGLPDLVRQDESGLLVEEQDADALAEAILALARDPDRRIRMGSAAKDEMRKRSWANVATRFVDVYEHARA